MKIGSILIHNFKSIRDAKLELSDDVNILVGKNNTGKSNTLGSITTLSKLTTQNYNNINEFFQSEFGGFRHVAFGGQLPCSLSFDVSFTLSKKDISDICKHYPQWEKMIPKESPSCFLRYKVIMKGEESGWGGVTADFESEELTLLIDKHAIPIAKGAWKSPPQGGRMYLVEILKEVPNPNLPNSLDYIQLSGRAPAMSMLTASSMHYPNQPMEYLLVMISRFLKSVQKLDPFRESPDRANVQGASILSPTANNLPQVLNTLASSRRELYDKIVKGAREIISELSEIRAALSDGSPTTYLSMTESSAPEVEYLWNNISSGARETLYLITLLYTSPHGSLLMIEEPELHLHWEAQVKLMSLMKEVARTDDKQILITTHSPALIDSTSLDKMNVISRESGETKITPFKQYELTEGMTRAGIPSRAITQPEQSRYLLVVESRDDAKVWRQFFMNIGLNPEERQIVILSGMREGGEGTDEAIHVAKMLRRIGTTIPWKLVLDSDGQADKTSSKLKTQDIPTGKYHILGKKEIESYLIDAEAIAKVTGKPIETVQSVLKGNMHGKEGLENIFKQLGLTKPNANVKEVLAANLPSLDAEIASLISQVQEAVATW